MTIGLSFPRRWEMALMLFSGCLVSYTLRVNMSVAVTSMAEELGWSESAKGLSLSAFYWGYTIGQLPASRCVQEYGSKWIFGLSVLLAAIATLFVPVASRASFGLLLFLRALIGIFESLTFPAIYQFIPVWIPLEEKTVMVPFIYSGVYIGVIVSFSVSSALLESHIMINGHQFGSWDACFYIFGLLGIAWFPYWIIMAYENPTKHPGVSQEELKKINEGKHYLEGEELEDLQTRVRELSYSPMMLDSNYQPEMFDRGRDYSITGPEYSSSKKNSTKNESAQTGSNRHLSSADAEDIYHENSVPIALENVAMNMVKTRTKKNARLDGKQTVFPGRPRKLSIVKKKTERKDMSKRIPWMHFLTDPIALTIHFNCWVDGFIGFTLLSLMPAFLETQFGFDIQNAAALCVFPYLALFVSTLSFGVLFEYLEEHHGWSTNAVRRWSSVIAYGGAAVGLIICSFMTNKYVGYIFMILTLFVLGASNSGLNCACSDVAPNYSSALNTVANTVCSVAGIVGPMIITALIETGRGPWGWRYAFFLVAGQVGIGLALWFTYQTSDPVPYLNEPLPEKNMTIQSIPKNNNSSYDDPTNVAPVTTLVSSNDSSPNKV